MFQQVLGPLQGIPGRKVVPEIPIEFKFMKLAVCIVTGCPKPIFVTPCGKGVVFFCQTWGKRSALQNTLGCLGRHRGRTVALLPQANAGHLGLV